MKLKDYKHLFITIGLIGILLLASPIILETVTFPTAEQFPKIFILGPDKTTTNIPFNVIPNTTYSVYLGIGNYLDTSTHYVCCIKVRNQTDPLPTEGTSSSSIVGSICEYHIIVQKGADWTFPLEFSLNELSVSNNQALLQSITIDNIQYNLNKTTQFEQDNNGYYYQILIELWAYYPLSDVLDYQNRYVYFWLNMTLPL